MSMLNLCSLILGIAAWITPFAGKRHTLSFALCCASLLCQICNTQNQVQRGDWAAIEDTHCAVTCAAAALLAGTVILNAIAHYLKSKTK